MKKGRLLRQNPKFNVLKITNILIKIRTKVHIHYISLSLKMMKNVILRMIREHSLFTSQTTCANHSSHQKHLIS
jgi:hypothetical protein